MCTFLLLRRPAPGSRILFLDNRDPSPDPRRGEGMHPYLGFQSPFQR